MKRTTLHIREPPPATAMSQDEELARLREELQNLKLENQRLREPVDQGNGARSEGGQRREVVYIPRERKCPNFSGKTGPGSLSIEDWLEEVECCTRGRQMSEVEKALFMYDHLEGEARSEIKFRPRTDRENATVLINVLTELYSCSNSYVSLQYQFFDRRQKEGESLQEYSLGLLSIMDRILKTNSAAMPSSDQVLQDQFCEGVRDHMLRRELKKLVRQTPTLSLLDLRKEAIRWVEEGQPQRERYTRQTPHSHETQVIVTSEGVSARQSELIELKDIVMKQQDIVMKQQEQLDKLVKALGPQSDYNRGVQRPRQNIRFRRSADGQPICIRCNQAGHIARYCKNNSQERQVGVAPDREETEQQKN